MDEPDRILGLAMIWVAIIVGVIVILIILRVPGLLWIYTAILISILSILSYKLSKNKIFKKGTIDGMNRPMRIGFWACMFTLLIMLIIVFMGSAIIDSQTPEFTPDKFTPQSESIVENKMQFCEVLGGNAIYLGRSVNDLFGRHKVVCKGISNGDLHVFINLYDEYYFRTSSGVRYSARDGEYKY